MIGASLEPGVKPMANRKVKLDVKVQAMRECLRLENAQSVMRKYGLSERSAFRWFEEILEQLPEILQPEKTGPKPQSHPCADIPAAPPRRRSRSAKR
jgi:hypothetical protein